MKPIEFNLALITGASGGIGEALARLLAAKKIPLILVARSVEKLESLAKSLPVQAEVFVCDLSSKDERKKLIDLIKLKKPDLIVNNAGFGLYGSTLSYPSEEMLNMIEVDISALVEISMEGSRTLISSGKQGVIMNISSIAGFFPLFPYFGVYCASKSFVNSFSLSLDQELESHGVRVLTSCPGMVDTAFRYRASGDQEMQASPITMSVEYAANQIWHQIEQKRTIHAFNWKFRFLTALVKILPLSILGRVLKASVENRFPKRKLIL